MKKILCLILIVLLSGLVYGKKLQDYSELTTGNLVDADLLRVEDMSAGAGLRTKKILASSLKAYMFESAFSLGGKLTGGSNEIEGSNFDINGGTVDNVSGGADAAWTFLQVDNFQFNGNTLAMNGAWTATTSSNGDITFTPSGTGVFSTTDIECDLITSTDADLGELDVDNLNFNTNTIAGTGAVTITTTSNGDVTITPNGTGVLATTDIECANVTATSTVEAVSGTFTGDTAIAGNLYLNGSSQTITGTGTALAAQPRTLLRTGAGAATITMTDGVEDGQMHYIIMNSDGGGDATLSGGKLGFTSMVFKNEGNSIGLMWIEADDLWYPIGPAGGTFNE